MYKNNKRVSLKDLSKLSGKSLATVSLALKGDNRVNIHTRKRIEKLANQLNYVPNELGRSLRSNKSDTVAFIFPNTANSAFHHPYFIEMLEGVSNHLVKNGYHLLLSTTPKDAGVSYSYNKILKNKRADGIILWPTSINDHNVNKIFNSEVPLVYLSKWHDGQIATVSRNDFQGAYDTTTHLISTGRSRIVHIKGPSYLRASLDRREGYREALEDAGINYDPSLEVNGDFSKESGQHAIDELLQKKIEFDSIFASNDIMAIGAMEKLKSLGYMIPKDFSIAGCDDIDMASLIQPTLTTIYHPLKQIGEIAAQLIIQLIEGKKIKDRQIVIPTELIVRESTNR